MEFTITRTELAGCDVQPPAGTLGAGGAQNCIIHTGNIVCGVADDERVFRHLLEIRTIAIDGVLPRHGGYEASFGNITGNNFLPGQQVAMLDFVKFHL